MTYERASSITFFKEEDEQVRSWDDAHEARGWLHKSDLRRRVMCDESHLNVNLWVSQSL